MDMEVSDFHDWMKAAEVLTINDKMATINCLLTAGGKSETIQREFRRMQSEQMIALGENPFKPDQALIEKTRKKDLRLKKNVRSKRDNSKAKT